MHQKHTFTDFEFGDALPLVSCYHPLVSNFTTTRTRGSDKKICSRVRPIALTWHRLQVYPCPRCLQHPVACRARICHWEISTMLRWPISSSMRLMRTSGIYNAITLLAPASSQYLQFVSFMPPPTWRPPKEASQYIDTEAKNGNWPTQAARASLAALSFPLPSMITWPPCKSYFL